MPRLKHCPIVRYKVKETIQLLIAGEVKLQKMENGHAEVLGGETGSEALGWISRKQLEQIELALSKIRANS